MSGAWMSGGSLKSGMQKGSAWTRVLQPSSSGQDWNARWSALECLALGKMFKEESQRPRGCLVIHPLHLLCLMLDTGTTGGRCLGTQKEKKITLLHSKYHTCTQKQDLPHHHWRETSYDRQERRLSWNSSIWAEGHPEKDRHCKKLTHRDALKIAAM